MSGTWPKLTICSQKTHTAPAYEGKGKGRAMAPITWFADIGASTTADDVESAFAADIQRAIDRSRRESLRDATRLSSGGGDPGPSSSSRSSSVSSVFGSPGASYSPMSPVDAREQAREAPPTHHLPAQAAPAPPSRRTMHAAARPRPHPRRPGARRSAPYPARRHTT